MALSAESYLLNGRYDYKVHERFFWYGSTGWDRNRFAGIQNRYVADGGIGNVMSTHLALKISLQWLFDNEPAFREFELENPLATPTGTQVVVELDELDTIFTSSLVVNF